MWPFKSTFMSLFHISISWKASRKCLRRQKVDQSHSKQANQEQRKAVSAALCPSFNEEKLLTLHKVSGWMLETFWSWKLGDPAAFQDLVKYMQHIFLLTKRKEKRKNPGPPSLRPLFPSVRSSCLIRPLLRLSVKNRGSLKKTAAARGSLCKINPERLLGDVDLVWPCVRVEPAKMEAVRQL